MSEEKAHLADFNGTGSSREAGQAGFEGRDLRKGASATGIDARHTELISRAGLQLNLLHLAIVRNGPRVVLKHIRQLDIVGRLSKRSTF